MQTEIRCNWRDVQPWTRLGDADDDGDDDGDGEDDILKYSNFILLYTF